MTPESGDCGQALLIGKEKLTSAIIHSTPGWTESNSRSPWQDDKDATLLPLPLPPLLPPPSSKSCGGARQMKSELSHKSMSHFHLGSGDQDTNAGPLNILRWTPRCPSFSPERRAAAVKITFTSHLVTPPEMESLAASHSSLSVDWGIRALRAWASFPIHSPAQINCLNILCPDGIKWWD